MEQKPKNITVEEIEKLASAYIAREDEDAEIIPDGKVNDAAKFMADFVHYLWEIDVIYEPLDH